MKVNPNSVKQEFEKQDELKRSALRAVAALLTIPDAGNTLLKDYVNGTLPTTLLYIFLLFSSCYIPLILQIRIPI